MNDLELKFIEIVSKSFDDFGAINISKSKTFCKITSKILSEMGLKYKTNDLRNAQKVYKMWKNKEIEMEIKK